MKIAELRELSVDELKKKINETRRELFNLRLQWSTQQLKNPLKLRTTRRMVARLLTILKEKNKS